MQKVDGAGLQIDRYIGCRVQGLGFCIPVKSFRVPVLMIVCIVASIFSSTHYHASVGSFSAHLVGVTGFASSSAGFFPGLK